MTEARTNESSSTNLYVIREGEGELIWVSARTPFDAATLAHRAGFLLADTFEVMAVGNTEAEHVKVQDDDGTVTSLKEEFARDPSRRVITWNEP